MKKVILITGGAGFIGSGFTRYFYKKYQQYKILILDALTYAGFIENLPDSIRPDLMNHRFEFCYGSINDVELVDKLVSKSDLIIHFAGESHVSRSIYDNSKFFLTDVLGTQVLANAVYKHMDRVERFIHISTSEVYGTAVTETISENHPLNPTSPYAGAKAGADRLISSYVASYQIPAIIVRLFNNFGPRQHVEKLIPRLITNLLLNETPCIHGSGEAMRDFVFVEDTCRALDQIIHAPPEQVIGETFNVGTSRPRSVMSVFEDICEMMDCKTRHFHHTRERPGQVLRHRADCSRIESSLGWRAEIPWKEGLQKTVQWYRDNEAWWRRLLWIRQVPLSLRSGHVAFY